MSWGEGKALELSKFREPSKFDHKWADINNIRVHYVERGTGPLIILCHGFPHSWYSWHRQISHLADAGWRVIAPDLRGMGETDAPASPQAYDCFQTAGDLAALLDHLGEDQAVFAGLDFGIFAIYDLAHLHPNRVKAIIALENPHYPERPDISPLAEAAAWAENHFVHIEYFRPEGVADVDLAKAPHEFITRVLYALSGDYHYLDVWKHPVGTKYLDALPTAPPLPWAWISAEELDVMASTYAGSGFTGGLNWYRAMDIRWEQRAAWRGHKTQAPFYFIGSEHDVDLEAWHGDDPLGDIYHHHADVRQIDMLPKAGHLIQLEKSRAVNALLDKYLTEIYQKDCGKA